MQNRVEYFDVVVCGGGLAGVLAAISAARTGKPDRLHIALIEERPVLGGNSSSLAGVPPHGATAIGNNRNAREGGILEELRMQYAERSPLADNRQFWDRILKETCLKESNLTLYMNTRVTGVDCSDGIIHAVTAIQSSTETHLRIQGTQFIEASGDGFVAMQAGAHVRMGREAKTEFGEIYAIEKADAKTLGSTIYITAQKRDYPVPFKPAPGSLAYIDCAELDEREHTVVNLLRGNALAADASSFRVFWWLELGGERNVIDDAEAIYEDLVAELMGVWDHLKNHCTLEVREALRNYDLVSWSLIPLKRGSRRVLGAYTLTEDDIFNPKKFEDQIGYGGFPIDLHPPMGIRSTEPPCVQIFLNELYAVPYRCLYSPDIINLSLAGRCIGATHVAMGSLRVMNTLGSLGQAAGTAAALCVAGGFNPNDISGIKLKSLQQRLLRDDLHIIGVKNEDSQDFARNASVMSNGSMQLDSESVDGFFDLSVDVAQVFPIPCGKLDRISVFLRNSASDSVVIAWQVSRGSGISSPENARILQDGTYALPGGFEGWVPLCGNLEFEDESLIWIAIMSSPKVSWAYSSAESFGTRFALKWNGSMDTASVHGKALIAPKNDDWISPNHHGRLPHALASLIKTAMSTDWTRRPAQAAKPYITLCTRFEPPLFPYGSSNVVNGISRAADFPNLWISDPAKGFPQELVLSLTEIRSISEISLTFDTCLDAEDRVFGFPRQENRFAFPIPECIRDYSILFWIEDSIDSGKWVEMLSVQGNSYRRRIHRINAPMSTDKVAIRIESTNGSLSARIFEVRLY